MKTRFLVVTAAAALMIGALAFAGTEPEKNSAETELDRLQKKISALEARVKSLEKRLELPALLNDALQLQPGIQTQPQNGSEWLPPREILHPFTPSSDGSGQRPKIWGEGEINGWKYYLIPCGGASGPSAAADPLKVAPSN